MMFDGLRDFFDSVGSLPAYHWLLRFFVFYPIWSALVWVSTALLFYVRRERRHRDDVLGRTPSVTVLVRPGHPIRRTLAWAARIDYPDYEIAVVDDGQSERTRELAHPYERRGLARLVPDESLANLRGAIVLVLEAGACPDPKILRRLVPHFRAANVGAVIGNPRVANRVSFLAHLQVVELASVTSLIHRAQRVWGRVMTAPGGVVAYRKSALVDTGHDRWVREPDTSWMLQSTGYDVRYEPRAFAWIRVQSDWAGVWRERRVRAAAFAHVLFAQAGVLTMWRQRRLWPVYLETALSTLWACAFAGLTLFWLTSYALGVPPVGASPLPNWWAMMIATLSLSQILTGLVLESRYDRSVLSSLPMAIAYPLLWVVQSFAIALSTLTPKPAHR
ncbi:MAG TPA: glycosyltransferase family 2 protein [Candidatus Eisenbacteria bacterium]|nr:glycosyltransferase family 2 protein [Candidatus Eisenbacteria bacterium]